MTPIEKSDQAYKLHWEAMELRGAGKTEEAAALWAECVLLCRDEPIYYREYADCLARLRRWEEDLRYAKLSCAMDPSSGESWLLAGAACGHLGRQSEAKRYYDRANALAPNSVAVRFNLSLWELLHGDYEQGWKDYKWRLMHAGQMRTLKPEWDGSPMGGRVLYVWSEQGIGDALQFVRFLPRLKAESGAHIVLEPHRELLELFLDMGVADEVRIRPVGGGLGFDDFEHISLMSIPRVLGINDPSEFWTGEYIHAKGADIPGARGRVGVCFKGRAENPNDKTRSLPNEYGESIMHAVESSGACSVSLMPTDEYLTTFDETIGLIGDLDLVITVDTAVAHLAGAMGKPTWLMVPFAPDWRWCVNYPDSTPWYPSMRLFRQPEYGDWASVVGRVRTALGDPGICNMCGTYKATAPDGTCGRHVEQIPVTPTPTKAHLNGHRNPTTEGIAATV